MTRRIGIVAALLFIATVWLANWLIVKYGPVPVGFGLEAPAGVYAAGLAFTLRDIVHRTLGRSAVIFAIIAGCALAYLITNGSHPDGYVSFAVASAIAFLLSELADLAVYTPLSERTFTGAVLVSNTVGVVIDSLLFLILAFGSLTFFWGQVVGKWWMTLAAIPLLIGARRLTPSTT